LNITDSILKDIREKVGLDAGTESFDSELLGHINSIIGELNQNGVGKFLVVTDESQTWADLRDPLQVEGNKMFATVPLFVALSTKMIFDPPPPSSVEYHSNLLSKMLWRLKIAYEEPSVPTLDVEERI